MKCQWPWPTIVIYQLIVFFSFLLRQQRVCGLRVSHSNAFKNQKVKPPNMTNQRPSVLKMAAIAWFKIQVSCRKTKGVPRCITYSLFILSYADSLQMGFTQGEVGLTQDETTVPAKESHSGKLNSVLGAPVGSLCYRQLPTRIKLPNDK